MPKKYDSQEFVQSLTKKLTNFKFAQCPYCGGSDFTTTPDYASIIVSDDFSGLQIGNSIPAGLVICKKCGHIEFFALGALGLMPKKDGDGNGDK